MLLSAEESEVIAGSLASTNVEEKVRIIGGMKSIAKF
jgi:hypothetical protein